MDNQIMTTSNNHNAQLARSLNLKHQRYLNGRTFSIESSHQNEVLSLKVILQNENQSYFYPVESRLDLAEQDVSLAQAETIVVEFIDCYFEEYFGGDEDTYLPIDWADFEVGGISFQVKGQILNLYLEKMADSWLSENQSSAFQ
jgi:hypothetical protein